MADQLSEIRYELALANRILSNEGVIDAFGHVSVRHPANPDRYLLSRSRSPTVVEPGDIYEYDLESQKIGPEELPPYSERVIHGEIYKARPDVMAVVHHHSPAFMPFVITGMDFVPVFHLGAIGGANPPFWDQRDEFGDTNMLVVKPEEGASLARALGNHWMVLMNRHGVTVAGSSIKDVVFRSIYSRDNADYQVKATAFGSISPLTAGEVEKSSKIATSTTGQGRAWEYWSVRLARAGGTPPQSVAATATGKSIGKSSGTRPPRVSVGKPVAAKQKGRR